MTTVSVFAAWMTLSSCTRNIISEDYLQREASDLQQRTIPPGSRLVSQHPPTLRAGGVSADWEIESTYDADAYKSWLINRLRPDFQVRETANSRLQFIKDANGDVETLSGEMTSSSGRLHVAVKLEIYPD